jgi:hypothetical protein
MENYKLTCNYCGSDKAYCYERCECTKCLNKDKYDDWKYSAEYRLWIKKQILMQKGLKLAASPTLKEIDADLQAREYNLNKLFPTIKRRGADIIGPRPTDEGMGGKISIKFLTALKDGVYSLIVLGIDEKTATLLYKKRALVEMGIVNGRWDMITMDGGQIFWTTLIRKLISLVLQEEMK